MAGWPASRPLLCRDRCEACCGHVSSLARPSYDIACVSRVSAFASPGSCARGHPSEHPPAYAQSPHKPSTTQASTCMAWRTGPFGVNPCTVKRLYSFFGATRDCLHRRRPRAPGHQHDQAHPSFSASLRAPSSPLAGAGRAASRSRSPWRGHGVACVDTRSPKCFGINSK